MGYSDGTSTPEDHAEMKGSRSHVKPGETHSR